MEVIDSYNGETIPGEYLSITRELTTGATIYYKLVTPTTESIVLPKIAKIGENGAIGATDGTIKASDIEITE